jgi:pimeloyl-ACP methyl ester carboxylesterase
VSARLRRTATPHLDLAWEEGGAGPVTAVLVHGWPDDPRAWDGVASLLHRAGVRTAAPFLRGFGPTRFRDAAAMRGGQISALTRDLLDFLDALGEERVLLVGHDWGARAAYGVAALAPQRLLGLVACSVGYGTSGPGQQLSFEQARAYWYHWYFALERGRQTLERDRRDFVRRIWSLWAPSWRYTDAEFDASAPSFDNPDWIDVTLHSYRHRWGLAPGDPRYDGLERQLAEPLPVTVPTVMLHGAEDGATLPETSVGKESFFTAGYRREVLAGIGHFVPREAPDAVAAAALELLAREGAR